MTTRSISQTSHGIPPSTGNSHIVSSPSLSARCDRHCSPPTTTRPGTSPASPEPIPVTNTDTDRRRRPRTYCSAIRGCRNLFNGVDHSLWTSRCRLTKISGALLVTDVQVVRVAPLPADIHRWRGCAWLRHTKTHVVAPNTPSVRCRCSTATDPTVFDVRIRGSGDRRDG